MTRTITAADIDRHVIESLTTEAAEFDTDAITAEIIDTYGLIDISATDEDGQPIIPDGAYWAIVAKHARLASPTVATYSALIDTLNRADSDDPILMSIRRDMSRRLAVAASRLKTSDLED